MGLYAIDKWLRLTVLAAMVNLLSSAEALAQKPQMTSSTPIVAESSLGTSCVVDAQCTTHNSSCKSGTCSCDGDLYYAKQDCRVRPVINGVLVIASVETQVFTVLWYKLNLKEGEQPHIYVTAKNGTHQKCKSLGTIGCNFFGLEPGSEYFISFKITDVNGIPSHLVNLSTYTKPNPPPQPATIVRWESNLTLTWNDGQQHNCDYYDISISPVPTKGNDSIRIPDEEKLSTMTFANLVGGTFYTVTILAVAGKYNASTMVSMYTRPKSPYNATLLGQTDSTLNISAVYDGENDALIQYRIHIVPPLTSNDCCNDEQSLDNSYSVQFANTSIFPVNGLKSGTLYNLTIYSWLDELESETATYVSNYTRPKGPTKPSIGNITSTGFIVSFSGNGDFDLFTVQFCLDNNITCPEVTNTTEDNYVAYNLTAGTNYKVIVNTILHNSLESLDRRSVSSYTRPNGLLNISVPVENIHERNATVNITSKDNLFHHIVVKLYNNTSELPITFNSTTITKLIPGTKYKIEVLTATITDLKSSEHLTQEFNTRPATPNVGIPIERGLDYITFNLSGNYGSFDHFDITDEVGKLITTVSSTGNKKFIAHNLMAGTHFAYKVYTNYSMLRSDGYVQIEAYTKPDQIMNMTITDITSSSMHVTWGAPMFGDVTAYQSTIICLGPNDNSEIKTFHDISSSLTAVTTGLEPGSICNVSVTTQINDTNEIVLGNATTATFVNCTIESAPREVQNHLITDITSKSITIEWNRPLVRNGIIDEYEINVLQNNSSLQTYILNCTRCIMAAEEKDLSTIAHRCANASVCDSAVSDKGFSYNITSLHPFRTYDISVLAKTSLVGNETRASNWTHESAPNGPPSVSSNTTTATEIEIKWSPPEYGYRNGIITKYKISYTFVNKTCFDDANGDNITKHELYENNSTAQTLTGLDPYTDHYVRIQAFTSEGGGPFSDAVIISTKQSRPSEVRGLNASSMNDESISLSWSQPCRTYGDITNYTIYLTNIDNKINRTMTTSNNSFEILDNILPYSNYTITVAGNTVIGEGNKTEGVRVRTRIGAPKIPRGLGAQNVSSKEINVTWATPDLYTGPTHYIIVVTDNKNTSINKSKSVQGFHSKTTIIDELDQYWLYNIKVISVTDVGHAESKDILTRTDEDVPEEVKGLQVIPEEDITKPRTIKVKWNLLTDREKNGILKSYSVRYSFHYTEKNEILNPTEREYVIKDIGPGHYTIKVYASTEKGKGKDSSSSTILQSGAPLKVPEPPGQPLIRQASIAVDNDETQIAIELPLESFLCNKSNGEPIEWGIIVSESALATDEPFVGNKTAFDHRKNTTYTRWSKAKNMDLMPAYIATSPGVYDPCKSVGNRKKRSTSQSSHGSFTVGTDGKCSGAKDNYCNGELPPDRSFRVKSYVCTDGGCTETNYGQPIKTVPHKAQHPTILIAAVVSLTVVVIVIVLIVATAFKRKQLACFKRDVVRSSTHVLGDGIEFDRMESTKARPFTPGPIKMSNFPERVAVMHRNSDLMFSNAYKLLGERSPKHPMLASEAQSNRLKNRYTNILPFDHSRVKLRPLDGVEGSDYINANYIPGYTSRHEYIATQEPMRATFDDFWRMVWEQNVDTIVMLTMENGRLKCDQYWPDLSDSVHYGDLVVTVSSESNFTDYTIRNIHIKSECVTKKVRQFCYRKWPDMGCPDKPHLLLKFVTNVRNYTETERQDKLSGPMVVHCRTGVDRTGTFIAVDTLLQQVRDHDEVDIFSLVLEMRNQRLNMVQTEDQYVFLHECVNAFISAEEDNPKAKKEPVYVNTVIGLENVYKKTNFSVD